MRTLEEHRDFILEMTDLNNIADCIAQVEHAISISVGVLVNGFSDEARREHMRHELEMEVKILDELQQRKGIR